MLSYTGILNPSLINHTKNVLGESEELTYYIHKTPGWVNLETFLLDNNEIINTSPIKIFNVGHNQSKQNFIRDLFTQLDKIIDLDFKEMNNNIGSKLDIYYVNYSSSFNQNIIGQAISQHSNAGYWWEIIWKDSGLSGGKNIDSNLNTIIHEIGHSLGLGHPYNDPLNESWTSEDTIMSYNRGPNGWSTWFSQADIHALISIWGRENDDGFINFEKSSSNYKFKKTSADTYSIKTEIGLEDISEIETLSFSDKSLNVKKDIIDVFNLIGEIDSISGKIYRLYNASFKRFPDKSGLKYWIKKNESGEDTYNNIAKSFIISDEFASLYGIESTNQEYIQALYNNVLNRQPDNEGFKYWANQLEGGYEDRSQLLIGFSESIENKTIFSQETNIF